MGKIISLCMPLGFLFFCLILLPLGLSQIINVPENYSTIQQAINNVNNGDVINVGDGIYNEDLVMNKSIELNGTSSFSTIIKGFHVIKANNIIIKNFNFSSHGNTAITIDSSSSPIDNIKIINSVFDLSLSPSIGIYVGGANPNNKISNILISNNVFYGPDNKNCNPWKIGGDFSTGGLSAEIDGINFTNNIVNKCSTPVNLQDQDIKNIFIDNNIFRNTDGVIYFWAFTSSKPKGVLSDFVFTNNDIDSTNSYGIGIDGASVLGPNFNDSNFGNGNRINFNNFYGIPGSYGFDAVSFLANVNSYKLNATFNWWGDCSGPGGAGSGLGSSVSSNVLFSPWLGICIVNKTMPSCAFQDKNIVLNANLIWETPQLAWFSYTINGANYNKTASNTGGNTYSITIPSSELVGGKNISWNVYANDSFGKIFNNSWKEFYVLGNTNLTLNISDPDGLNGWYVSEPLFSLIKDVSGIKTYYDWDSSGGFLYTSPFGLENIPNAPSKESAGILNLKYWTDFGICGNESVKNKTFYIDLTSPVIKNLLPVNNSIIFNISAPLISTYIDEVYQSNSGINLSSVKMYLDGNLVQANIVSMDSIDARVSFTPLVNLSEGHHNVSVFVQDNAGRKNILNWSFTINSSLHAFNLTVYSPENFNYSDRRINFNLSVTKRVSRIEFINWNDDRPDWRTLCRDCISYGFTREKSVRFNEGLNNLTIRAADYYENFKEENINLFVDSKKPVISVIKPRTNEVINGSSFYIKYSEENLKDVWMNWNPCIKLASCNESGINKECVFDMNLSDFDGELIEFWFNISDSVGYVESRKTRVYVDTTSPVLTINNPFGNEEVYGRKVPFNISVSEDVVLEYYDDFEVNPRWRRLCTRCNGYGLLNEKSKYFKRGTHDLLIRAVDKAGNSDIEQARFEVEY